jgi:hypothetical protein
MYPETVGGRSGAGLAAGEGDGEGEGAGVGTAAGVGVGCGVGDGSWAAAPRVSHAQKKLTDPRRALFNSYPSLSGESCVSIATLRASGKAGRPSAA